MKEKDLRELLCDGCFGCGKIGKRLGETGVVKTLPLPCLLQKFDSMEVKRQSSAKNLILKGLVAFLLRSE